MKNFLYKISVVVFTLVLAACGSDGEPGNSTPDPISQPVQSDQFPTSQPATIIVEDTAIPQQTITSEGPDPVEDAATPISQADDLRGQQMVDYLNSLEGEGRFMGSVLVAQGGNLLLKEGFGSADIESGIRNTPNHQYRIGSLTKQFTAAAVLLLQEEGLLNVQEPISTYLPDYPNGDNITIHQLLIHTAGIPNYEQRRDLPQVVQSPISLDDLISSFSDQPLQFAPGQQYSYSSSGYILLTKIIEVVSGMTYEDYIQEKILNPAGMFNSGYDYLDPSVSNPSVGYMMTQRGSQRAILTDASWPSGAGALYSTLDDLYRWDQVLYQDDILSADSIEMMHTPWVDTGQGASYGYGWDIGTTVGHQSIAHGGGIFGFASYMLRFPNDDAVIIVLSNGIQMPPRIAAEELAGILFSG